MRNWFRTSMMAAGVAAVVSLAVVPTVLRGQAPPAVARARGGARSAHGGRQAELERHLAGDGQLQLEPRRSRRLGRTVLPGRRHRRDSRRPEHRRGGDIPYTPAALAKRNENARNRLTLDPEVKCYMPGIPRANYMPYPFQIVQSPQNILFAYEYASANRVVNMGKPTEAPVDSWMGWSNGKWEGDTLVVDVTGLNGNAWLDRAGNFTTDATHVVERFTLTDADHINYEATIEDAKLFTRPWKISTVLYKHMEKNFQLLEFKCVEFAEELLYGHLRKKY